MPGTDPPVAIVANQNGFNKALAGQILPIKTEHDDVIPGLPSPAGKGIRIEPHTITPHIAKKYLFLMPSIGPIKDARLPIGCFTMVGKFAGNAALVLIQNRVVLSNVPVSTRPNSLMG